MKKVNVITKRDHDEKKKVMNTAYGEAVMRKKKQQIDIFIEDFNNAFRKDTLLNTTIGAALQTQVFEITQSTGVVDFVSIMISGYQTDSYGTGANNEFTFIFGSRNNKADEHPCVMLRITMLFNTKGDLRSISSSISSPEELPNLKNIFAGHDELYSICDVFTRMFTTYCAKFSTVNVYAGYIDYCGRRSFEHCYEITFDEYKQKSYPYHFTINDIVKIEFKLKNALTPDQEKFICEHAVKMKDNLFMYEKGFNDQMIKAVIDACCEIIANIIRVGRVFITKDGETTVDKFQFSMFENFSSSKNLHQIKKYVEYLENNGISIDMCLNDLKCEKDRYTSIYNNRCAALDEKIKNLEMTDQEEVELVMVEKISMTSSIKYDEMVLFKLLCDTLKGDLLWKKK